MRRALVHSCLGNNRLQITSARACSCRGRKGLLLHNPRPQVAETIAPEDYCTRAEWEAALRAAKHKAMEGEWPVIRQGDFFR
jgi:hypothetical protein